MSAAARQAAGALPRIAAAFAAAPRRAPTRAVARPLDSTVHVRSTMNNVHVTISNVEGGTVSRASGGMLGFKHRKRAKPAAARAVATRAAEAAVAAGHRAAAVHFRGPSRARGQVLFGMRAAGLAVVAIRDVTPVPTNGCRPKAARRL